MPRIRDSRTRARYESQADATLNPIRVAWHHSGDTHSA